MILELAVGELVYLPEGGGDPIHLPPIALNLATALPVADVAARLGMTAAQVRALIRRRKLPAFRIDGKLFVPEDEVRLWPFRDQLRAWFAECRAARSVPTD